MTKAAGKPSASYVDTTEATGKLSGGLLDTTEATGKPFGGLARVVGDVRRRSTRLAGGIEGLSEPFASLVEAFLKAQITIRKARLNTPKQGSRTPLTNNVLKHLVANRLHRLVAAGTQPFALP